MLGNAIDTNQYFESLNLNDKRREQLFADMMNILYKTSGTTICSFVTGKVIFLNSLPSKMENRMFSSYIKKWM